MLYQRHQPSMLHTWVWVEATTVKGPQGQKRSADIIGNAVKVPVGPAMAAGIETRLGSMEDLVRLIDEHAE